MKKHEVILTDLSKLRVSLEETTRASDYYRNIKICAYHSSDAAVLASIELVGVSRGSLMKLSKLFSDFADDWNVDDFGTLIMKAEAALQKAKSHVKVEQGVDSNQYTVGGARIVEEVNDDVMDGDTDLEKKINAYLTSQFIYPGNVPSDECLREAREIIKMLKETAKK